MGISTCGMVVIARRGWKWLHSRQGACGFVQYTMCTVTTPTGPLTNMTSHNPIKVLCPAKPLLSWPVGWRSSSLRVLSPRASQQKRLGIQTYEVKYSRGATRSGNTRRIKLRTIRYTLQTNDWVNNPWGPKPKFKLMHVDNFKYTDEERENKLVYM